MDALLCSNWVWKWILQRNVNNATVERKLILRHTIQNRHTPSPTHRKKFSIIYFFEKNAWIARIWFFDCFLDWRIHTVDLSMSLCIIFEELIYFHLVRSFQSCDFFTVSLCQNEVRKIIKNIVNFVSLWNFSLVLISFESIEFLSYFGSTNSGNSDWNSISKRLFTRKCQQNFSCY